MLTPEQLKNLPVCISQQYTELADFILRDICRRIADAGKITDTAEYQIYRAKALGLSNKEIRNKIAEINGVSEKEVNKLFRDVAKTSDEFDRKVFKQPEDAGTPLEDNKVLQQVITAQAKQTNETFENITGTMGFAEKRDGQVVYSSLTDTLRKEMDAAHLKIASGATDYITAIRAATKKLSESGVRTIYYESGRSDRVDVAVRRAVLTGTSQVVQKISEQNGEQFGADGWEISAHAGARPSHAIYQGRQYPQKDYERIVRPLVEDYNCRHSAYPIILGVSEPTYTAEQLKHIDPPPFTYEGKTYTAYEATQQQRKMERAMRRQKDLCVASDAVGDKDGFTTASIKLRRQNEIYKDFSEKAGLYTQYERTQVQGFNRSIARKSAFEVDKYKKYYYYKDGHIRVTDDWTDRQHPKIPSEYRPNAVIDTKTEKNGNVQFERSFYDENGKLSRQTHTGHHGKPKLHPYGTHGEHHHYFTWKDGEQHPDRTTDELTDFERKESGDIL